MKDGYKPVSKVSMRPQKQANALNKPLQRPKSEMITSSTPLAAKSSNQTSPDNANHNKTNRSEPHLETAGRDGQSSTPTGTAPALTVIITSLFYICIIVNINLPIFLQADEINHLLDDLRKIKIIVKGHERRIKTLEDELAKYEGR